MFRDVLIGVDGRQGGHDAVALARQLASPKASFTLAHVRDTFYGRGAAEASALEHAASEQLLQRERELAGLNAREVIWGESSVGRGLHEIAENDRCDLLVVGSTRHALLGRVLLGDDCQAALTGARCAIAIAPRGYAFTGHHLRRLGVGYDGSPETERALDAARELAALHGAEIRALWVVSLQDVRAESALPADWPETTDELIERHTEQLAQIDDVTGVVAYGGRREELVKFGRDVDLLIVGSHALGALGRLLHGGVPRYLAGHVACPLLVLPPSVADSPDAATDHRAATRVPTPA